MTTTQVRAKRAARLCAAALLLVAAAPQADDRARGETVSGADPFAEGRALFLDALSRLESGAAETADPDALRSYPLYPYLEAARIEKAAATASGADAAVDAAARAFLAEHAGEPVASGVRRAWLESLVRREQWREFLDEVDVDTAGDVQRCRALRARIALDDLRGLAPEIVAVWLTGRRLPSECEPVFQWLRAEGPLTDELIEQRVRLLLENGHAAFARVIAARLPSERAAPLLLWADLLERPVATLDALLDAPAPLPEGALYAGWQRLARDRPAEALERYGSVLEAFDLDSAEASRFTLALALGLAWDRRPEALDFFARVAPPDIDDYALGWRARASMWAGEWSLAADAIASMSPETRNETRWVYWAARAAERLRDAGRARELYRSILGRDNYYSAMAAARLGRAAKPDQRTLDADRSRIRALAAQPAFVRARELLRVRMPTEATAEWRFGLAAIEPADRKQAIHLAASWGWHDVAIATATSQGVFYDYSLLYPRPYDEAVAAAAALTKLEPPLIYGVIRQESLYRRDAASAAGAIGLAQLRPETARRAARQWNRPVPSYADLLVPKVNVTLGAAELRTLLDEFDDQLPVALAGYNAGPEAARRWLPSEPLDADVWIENIPYNETRDYVQRVLWHSLVFAWLQSGEARDTGPWLTQVRPSAEPELHAER
ncbi:MAG TPA: transglycosylase SLT domain-containing protein [Gammaproteobacteria bacterium]